MKDYSLRKTEYKRVFALPDEFACEIGHIASRWSTIEETVKRTVYMVAPVPSPVGRIAIGTARQSEQLKKVQDLLYYHHLAIPPDLAKLQAQLSDLQPLRDKYVHAVWLGDDKGNIFIVDLSGKLDLGKNAPPLTKRMFPEALPVTVNDLKQLVVSLDAAGVGLATLHDQIRDLHVRTLMRKVRAEIDADFPNLDQT